MIQAVVHIDCKCVFFFWSLSPVLPACLARVANIWQQEVLPYKAHESAAYLSNLSLLPCAGPRVFRRGGLAQLALMYGRGTINLEVVNL